ncbi:MAG: hypothetical protein IKC32_01785 [Clostridia bacterium]|nr:hypothetical protein [Clostridia bacterium]
MDSSIYEKQGSSLCIKCLFAQHAKYNLAKFISGAYLIICVIGVALFTIIKTFYPNDLIIGLSLGLSFAATFASDSVFRLVSKLKKEAAQIQNYFDIMLFSSQDNAQQWHNKLSDNEIYEMVSKYPDRGFSDDDKWYEDFSSQPKHLQIVYCQKESLHWDYDLRKKYKISCYVFFGVLIFAIVITAICLELSFISFLGVCAWALPFIKYWIEFSKNIKNDELRVRRLKEIIFSHLHMKDALNEEGWLKRIIEWQDLIFEHRCKAVMVPNFFYRIFKGQQQSQEYSIAESINSNERT